MTLPSLASRLLLAIALVCSQIGCAGDSSFDRPILPAAVTIRQIGPSALVPQSVIVVLGENLAQDVSYQLLLQGTVARGSQQKSVNVAIPLSVGNRRAEGTFTTALFNQLGEGTLYGRAIISARNQWGEIKGPQAAIKWDIAAYLVPSLTQTGRGRIFLNAPITVVGDGLLLNPQEGQTWAELNGCFLPEGRSGSCFQAGKPVSTKVQLFNNDLLSRTRGAFSYAPFISGIGIGRFEGEVNLANFYRDGAQYRSDKLPVDFDVQVSRLALITPDAGSLGQYLEFRGAGFIGSGQGITIVKFDGTFQSTAATSPVTLSFNLVPQFVDGTFLKYVMDDRDELGNTIDLRAASGWILDGKWTPILRWKDKQLIGASMDAMVRVLPVKQVCWVRFTGSWSDSLRRFGLQSADTQIRKRVVEVMRRDYAGINLEFRTVEPKDYKLYARIDIGGTDPNGLGLLGYDNTRGKDVDNQRLYDAIGGVNALTQEDGYPGFGGIFAESMLGFSEHPPTGVAKSPLATALFDKVFDPFRPDLDRQEVDLSEVATAPQLKDATACPAADRSTQIACAILVLGNLVGTTASHEFGHSLGLADPYGPSTVFHNPGNLPNRLMEAGGDRPFNERAELQRKGPAVFCQQEFDYLRKILPTTQTTAAMTRPSCQ